MVGRPSRRVVRDWEDFHRARRGWEAILDGQVASRGPPGGLGGVERPSWRAGSHREDTMEGL